MVQVALFASGSGSNVLNLLETVQDLKNTVIPVVIIDQADSPLLNIIPIRFPKTQAIWIPLPDETSAKAAGVSRRLMHEQKILQALNSFDIKWCFLAGYMRVLSSSFIRVFTEKDGRTRIVNIHPSLLPAYPGIHAYERAFEAGETTFGVTLHFVDETLDGGPVIRQEVFNKKPGDDISSVVECGKALEWKIYRELLTELDQRGTLHAFQ